MQGDLIPLHFFFFHSLRYNKEKFDHIDLSLYIIDVLVTKVFHFFCIFI
jgi:hypothetical protein